QSAGGMGTMSGDLKTAGFASAEDWYRTAAGVVLRRLRERRGWSFRDFGEQVNAAHTTLYAIERGDATPGIEVLERIAEACALSLPALLALIVDEMRAARTHERRVDDTDNVARASLADVA